MRRARLVLTMLLAGLLAAGCVQLPRSSSVQPGRSVTVPAQPQLPYIDARAPIPGAGRVQIVEDFLEAMMAYPQNPGLVREFLTPKAAGEWDPDAGVTVYETRVATATKDGVRLSVDVLGRLDDRGSWLEPSPDARALKLKLQMQKVKGEWRIANPPAGTLINSGYFVQVYQPLQMYFFNQTGDVLVPDTVYLPQGDDMATTLVNDLLQGPTSGLAQVVRTVVPPSSRQQISVSVSPTGTADVQFSRDFTDLSEKELRLFAAQLAWTLSPDSLGVSGLQIQVQGRHMNVPGVSQGAITFSVDDFRSFDPTGSDADQTLYALSRGRLVSVSTNTVAPVHGAIGHTEERARAFAVALDGERAALVTDHGHRVLVGSTTLPSGMSESAPATWWDGGHNIVDVSWDRRGVLWVVDDTKDGAVVRTLRKNPDESAGSPPAAVREVVAPGLSHQDVSAFAVSRDGVRYAAIVAGKRTTHLVVGLIDRDPDHPAMVRLIQQRQVSNNDYPLNAMTSLAWASPTEVALLAKDQDSDRQPYLVSIDGSSVTPQPGFLPVRPTALATSPGQHTPMALVSGDGQLYVRTPSDQWERVQTKGPLAAPHYPG